MSLLRNWLLFALLPGLAWSSSALTEVDLVFPRRNETYAPSPIVPIVFAIQNPRLLSSLRPRLSFYIDGGSNPDGRNSTGNLVHLNEEKNFTNSSDPYLLKLMTTYLNMEGNFSFVWHLDTDKCTHDSETDTIDFEAGPGFRIPFDFSMRHGASPPDLAAFTEQSLCAQNEALALHVSETLDLPPTQTTEWGAPSCAVDPEWTNPSPCNVQIDASTAANITAYLTATACKWPTLYTDVSCPTPTPGNAASMPQSPIAMARILAVGTLLACSLAW